MDSVEIVLVVALCLRVFPRQQESLTILKAITKNFSKTTRVNPLAHRLRYVLIVSRMLKKAVQQGRKEQRCEACASAHRASERSENEAGGLFQHRARADEQSTIGHWVQA